jgi:hypothetical protein
VGVGEGGVVCEVGRGGRGPGRCQGRETPESRSPPEGVAAGLLGWVGGCGGGGGAASRGHQAP